MTPNRSKRRSGDFALHEAAWQGLDPHFPDKSFTKNRWKPGWEKERAVESWVAVIRPANVLFEVDGVP